MKEILIDTNIIIYREKEKILNESVMNAFHWINNLGYKIVIHPESVKEIEKNQNVEEKKSFLTKIKSYSIISSIINPDNNFLDKISALTNNENDRIDNILLYYAYKGRVDYFVTEDKKLLEKARILNIDDKVFSISKFIEKCTKDNPEFKVYKTLNVIKKPIGNCDINDTFFDSLKNDYLGFEEWFARKSENECYVCYNEKEKIQGFLYLKIEHENENYSNMTKQFRRMKRLKIGTFKVVSTGYRLGERFIKIILDNAIKFKVSEIYVTMFENERTYALINLLEKWGFEKYCYKISDNKRELVMTKQLYLYDKNKSVKKNYPLVDRKSNKYILPIYPFYHEKIFPDAEYKTNNFNQIACSYALEKAYVSWALENKIKKGDFVFFYKIGENGTDKKFTSKITGYGIITEIINNFLSLDDFITKCKNITVFDENELKHFYKNTKNLLLIKFIYVRELDKPIPLKKLRDLGIVCEGKGPRPFTKIPDDKFVDIEKLMKTEGCV